MNKKPVEKRIESVTKQPLLTDFPSTIFATSKRRLQAQLRSTRDSLLGLHLDGYSQLFGQALPSEFLDDISPTKRKRHFQAPVLFWAWLAQILEANASCNKALSLIQSWCLKCQLPPPSSSTGAYCQARSSLPEVFLESIAAKSAEHLSQRITSRDQWRGLNLKAIDGSSVQLSDTPENQEAYPQPSGQKQGCGFPTMGIVGVTNLSHGGWEGFETCGWQKHDACMAPKLLKHIEQRDLLLADRAFCSYEFIARVTTEQKGQVLMRLHQARFKKLDWRKGKKVSSFERLVVWQKPACQPASSEFSKEQWQALPATMTLRYIKMGYENRSGEKRMLVVVTDLLDPLAYPGEELIDLYAERWEIEVKLRDVKTTLGLEFFRVQSPEMAHKTLRMMFIAYNLIRVVMQQAAGRGERRVREMGFKATVDIILSSRSDFMAFGGQTRNLRNYRERFLEICATKTLDIRPFRSEPRAVKRRPKSYQLLTKPRPIFQEIQHRSTYRKAA